VTELAQPPAPTDAAQEMPRTVPATAALLFLLIAAIAGAGTLAGFAALHDWRLELASHFRVQYFWALAVSAGVLLYLRWRIAALSAAALAATNLALIAPLYFGPPARDDAGRPLKAMSLNVLYENRNYSAIMDLILRELPDFVLLVEVTPECAKALEFLKPEYPHGHVEPQEGGSGGIAFYSRHPIEDLSFKLSDNGMPTLIVGLKTPGGRLTFIGTHPSSPRTTESFEGRNEQLEVVAEIAAARSGPVMLMGDLNTTSWSPYFQRLLDVSNLRDSRRGFGVEPSWPSLPLALLRIPIDHCLVSEEISVLERWIGPAVGSDHRGVLIEFALPEA
jgi:endonuclease/exonuclease/phosphatase (EEP) superfamily protein YafD